MTTISTSPSMLKGYNTTVLTKADVTNATGTVAWTTANSGLTLFTVTGAVKCAVYGVVSTLLTSTLNTGTLAVGIAGATTLFLGTTTANGSTNFILNSIWEDTSPTVLAKAIAGIPLTLAYTVTSNIILTIATNNMTAGGMTLYCDWIPVSAGATVV